MFRLVSNGSRIGALSLYLFALLLFAMPFNIGVLVPILYLWALVTIISYFVLKDYSLKGIRVLLLLPSVFFLVHVARAIFFGSVKAELSDFETKLSLLIIPLVFPFSRENYFLNRNKLLTIFVLGNAFALLVCYGFAIYRSFNFIGGDLAFTPNISEFDNYFFGANLSALLHPSYFSLYLNVCFLTLFAQRKEFFATKWKLTSWIILIILFFVSLLLLNSRIGIFIFLLLVVSLSIRSFFIKRRFFIGIAILGFILSILFALPHYGEKQFRSIHNETSQKIETGFLNRMSLKYYLTLHAAKDLIVTKKLPEWKEDWTTMRIYIWKGSLSLIESNIWVGIGPNSIKPALTNFYKKEGIEYAAESKLNCHNQFLETCLGIGLFGLVFLILLIVVPSIYAFRQKNWLFIGFIAFFIILFFVESAFNRIAGIASFSVFFSFFLSYFGLVVHKGKCLNSIN